MAESQWVRAFSVNDFPEDGTGRAITIEGLKIAVFRWNDTFYALENLCPHLGFPLTEGIAHDSVVICGWHGWRVRLDDGGCHGKTSAARTFPCKVDAHDLYVEIPSLGA